MQNVNVYKEIRVYNNIIIISTDADLSNFGWGFIENVYDIFFTK